VIVVVTEDFEVYHDVVTELRERDLAFRTVEPGEPLPAATSVVVTGPGDGAEVAGWPELEEEPPVVEADPGIPREAIKEAVRLLRGGTGRRVIGIDPGEKPGIAVLDGDVVVATFQVPPEEVPSVVRREAADADDPLVRVGDGARLIGARIVEELDEVPVELVDETGTTPYLGEGTRGVGDVLAAVNIARREGEPVDSREVQPTAGELQRIQERSREASAENRTIGTDLARKVAQGELTIAEALDAHRADE
jgi:hypothetical protein